MATFAYEGRRGGRERVEGELEGASAASVAAALKRMGITPVKIAARAPRGATFNLPGWLEEHFQGSVGAVELILFCRQMRALSRAGVPLGQALRGLAATQRNKRLVAILEDLARQIEGGIALSAALRRHGGVFSRLFVNLVSVGESTGRLDSAFTEIIAYLELERDTKRRIKAAIRYPAFVVGAMGIALVILNVYVIPVFADVFANMGAELPWQTRTLLAISAFFVDYWYALLLGAAAAAGAWIGWMRTERGARFRDALLLRLPILGDLYGRILIGRLCRTLAMVSRAGIPMNQGLSVAAATLDNRILGERALRMRSAIEHGDTLVRAARASRLFNPLVLQMIGTGEDTGELDSLLDQAAQFYEEEVDYQLGSLSSAIEPILIVAMGIMVLVLALGVFLPLWDLSAQAR